ncbi:MAG: Uma2 family endonuclease [Chloroflexota bacterium]|nr:Uma2 family endonuclease [Chloroflexota bacterium]
MTTPTKAPAQPVPKFERETRKFTVEEYYRMAEVGILRPDERVELIDGEVIVMPPIGEPHAVGVDNLTLPFAEVARGHFIVRVQGPIRLDNGSELQPDVVLMRPRQDSYISGHPGPTDVLLVIEVSDTTLAHDREVKLNLYARANIPETWIMNLVEDCIEAFTGPGSDGYANHAIYRRGDRISPSTLPDVEFAVDDLLPPVVGEEDEGGNS